jgi:ribulose-phosphate 3-epimerase
VLEEILPDVDLVMVMTVDPGFGSQTFLHTTGPSQAEERIAPPDG